MKSRKTMTKQIAYGSGYILPRVGKKETSYLARVRKIENGRKIDESKTFKKIDDAKAYIDLLSVEIRNGINLNKNRFKKYTIAQIYEEFIEHNPNDKRNYRLRRMLKTLSGITLEDFTSVQFDKLIEGFLKKPVPMQKRTSEVNKHKLHKGNMVKNEEGNLVRRTYSQSTVRKYYYDCRIVLDWHSRLHQYDFNEEPFRNTTPPQAWENQKDKIIEPHELELILKGFDTLRANINKAKMLVRFLSMTGFRIGETLLIKKSDVRLNSEESIIFIPKKNQKGGNTRKKNKIADRYCPIREEIYYLLKDELLPLIEKDNDLLFPEWKNGHAFYQRFKNACINVGLEDIPVHLLRHTAISYYFSDTNLTDIEIMNISGHLEAKTLLGYVKLRPKQTGKKLWKRLN